MSTQFIVLAEKDEYGFPIGDAICLRVDTDKQIVRAERIMKEMGISEAVIWISPDKNVYNQSSVKTSRKIIVG